MRKKWTKQEENLVITYYADSTSAEMIEILKGKSTAGQINHKARNLGIRKSDEFRQRAGFAKDGKRIKGVPSWNKGIKYNAGGRSVETQFKPGLIPSNHRPVGSIRITKDGYISIKIEEGRHKFRLLHREVWKQHHGSYPPPGYALLFRDGDKTNCDIKNLELVSRSELMKKNTVHRLPEEIKQVITTRVHLLRRIHDNYPKKRHKQTA